MLEFASEYGLFVAEVVTIVIAILVIIGSVASLAARDRKTEAGKIEVKHINERFEQHEHSLKHAILDEAVYKEDLKREKKQKKAERKARKHANDDRKRIFVIYFNGDVEASSVPALTEEVSAALTMARPEDEVVVSLESPGGMVHAYGLAASQLHRIKDSQIPLTVCVDKVAASGGYLMACLADKILAAPFAILGSIGVMAEVPNFYRVLKKHDVDYEILTAGEYKRTLSMFGENTEQGREKFMSDLYETHELFKQFVAEHRPQLDIGKVATGEVWYGSKAIEQKLIDGIDTTESYLMKQRGSAEMYAIQFHVKKSLQDRLGMVVQALGERLLQSAFQKSWNSRYYK